MNFYKRHLGDYAKDAGHLTMLEHGAYTLLLDRYYTVEQPIANREEAYRFCRARTRDEKAAVDTVLREFFVYEGESFKNRRAEEEIAKASHQRTVNQEIGKRGGRPKQTESQTESVIEHKTESETESVPVRNPTPDSRLQTPDSTTSERARARGTRLPPDWSPDPDGLAFAEQQGLRNGRAQAELARFRDYWTAQPGQKGVKADWTATWRNWVRRAAESGATKPATGDVFAGAL